MADENIQGDVPELAAPMLGSPPVSNLLAAVPSWVALSIVCSALILPSAFWPDRPQAPISPPNPPAGPAAIASGLKDGGGNDATAVLAAMQLTAAEVDRATALIRDGKLRTGWMKVWDNLEQDGDVVTVSGAGFSQTISITHAPTLVPVLYVPGQRLLLSGIFDGGGGITVAIEGASGPLPLPRLAPGQSTEVPFP